MSSSRIAGQIWELYGKIKSIEAAIPSFERDLKKSTQTEYDALKSDLVREFERKQKEIETRYSSIIAKANSVASEAVQEATRIRDQAQRENLENFQNQIKETETIARGVAQQFHWLGSKWNDQHWSNYSPISRFSSHADLPPGYMRNSRIPGGVRLGDLIPRVDLGHSLTDLPAILPFVGHGHILIRSRGETKASSLHLLQSIIMRVICTFPVNTARLVRIDPLGLGDNFPFKRLPESIRGDIVYSEADEIRAQLRELTEHMRLVTEKYLAKDYSDIEAYNRDAEEVVEAYRLLCIADFPVKFDADAATRLMSIGERGKRTGVYVIMHYNADQALPRDFNMDEFARSCSVIEAIPGMNGAPETFTFQAVGDSNRYPFSPDNPPQAMLFNQLLDQISQSAVDGQFQGIPFDRIIDSDRANWWQQDSRKLIQAPIGKAGAKDTLYFWLGQQPDRRISNHALVGGQTGMGKTTMLHVMINSMAVAYSPSELEMYLLDFKEGVDFRPYADERLPHAKVVSIESEREFGLSVLRRLQTEVFARAEIFKKAGVPDINTYRERTGNKLPRILLIIDEFQLMFQEADAISTKLIQLIDDLSRRGRSFGIHLVLASQSVQSANIPSTLFGQFATRIALKSPERDISALLGSDNTMAATLLERVGDVIYNDDSGRTERNLRGQIVAIGEARISSMVRELNEKREESDLPVPDIFVFRGNVAASIHDNLHLETLYDEKRWLETTEVKDRFGLKDWLKSERPAIAWLGEAVEIKPHTTALFKRRGRSNLLLVGDDEAQIFGMIGATFISLPLFHRPSEVQFRILDLSQKEEAWEDTCENFRDAFDQYDIRVVERRGVEQIIDDVAAVVEDRTTRAKGGDDITDPSLYFYVTSAHRALALRSVPGRLGTPEPSEYAKKLATIANNGADVGVHLIFTCDNIKTFEGIFGRSGLSQFDRRVALRMNRDESQMLLGEPNAATLKDFRALMLDEEASTALEKFKPYALPETKEEREALFKVYATKLQSRLGGEG